MALDAKILGNTSGNGAEVTSNGEVKVVGPDTYNANLNPQITGGFSNNIFEADSGSVTTAPLQRQGDISANYRQRVGVDTLLFNEQFNGTAINSALWSSNLTTFATSVSGGFLSLNSANVTTANAVARLSSYRGFPAYGSYPLQLEIEAVYASSAVQPNTTTELGFGFATGVTAPTDGAFFRYNASGELRAVICYNSTESQSAALPAPTVNARHHYNIVIGNDAVEFWIDNILYANLPVPSGNGMALLNQNTPVLLRVYNAASPPAAGVILKVAQVNISLGDMNCVKDWGHIQAGMGGHASQGQTGMTAGSTASYANNTNPTAAVPTNTTAALGSGLGGQFWSTASIAVNTDGIISSFQVPAPSASSPQKTLYITRIRIDSVVQAALAGGPFLLQWGLAYGHTAVSLATVEGLTTKAPRRVALGFQSFPATAAVGAQGSQIVCDLDVPILVQPGEFVQTIYKNIGTVGTAGTIAHTISIGGYWE